MPAGVSTRWAEELGLVEAPLFLPSDNLRGNHAVLLNGGIGSFAISDVEQAVFDPTTAASWAWSADVPHHVSLANDVISLLRWDDPASLRRFSRQSVEGRLETFYEYLRLDRIRSKYDVVEHSIDVFRRIRSFINEQGLPDASSIHAFLYIIASMLSELDAEAGEAIERLTAEFQLDLTYADVFRRFEPMHLSSLINQFRHPVSGPGVVQLIPQLLVRHAGGTVFQEAHFEFIRGGPTDLFGLAGQAEVKISTRGGTHFTPPGLARAVVEQALEARQLPVSLTILDPACGAGAFLQEALRYLQRANYRGSLDLIGYDISPNAAAMARFVLTQAVKTGQTHLYEASRSKHETRWPRILNGPSRT